MDRSEERSFALEQRHSARRSDPNSAPHNGRDNHSQGEGEIASRSRMRRRSPTRITRGRREGRYGRIARVSRRRPPGVRGSLAHRRDSDSRK